VIYILLNAWPITVAALSTVGIGALWYRKAVPTTTLVTMLIAHWWIAAILAGALILAPPKDDIWTMTLGSAFIIWIGFVAPVLAASYRLREVAWRNAASDILFWLVAMLVQATLMRIIGLMPPPV
jgi:hypothetical protein